MNESSVSSSSERREMDTIEVIVANGKYFGGGMLASPSSIVSDGNLDVHIMKPVSSKVTFARSTFSVLPDFRTLSASWTLLIPTLFPKSEPVCVNEAQEVQREIRVG